jgi:hypothetical protein
MQEALATVEDDEAGLREQGFAGEPHSMGASRQNCRLGAGSDDDSESVGARRYTGGKHRLQCVDKGCPGA